MLVLIGMTSAFLVADCQGNRKQGQESVLKIAISTVETHLMWNIYVDTGTDEQMQAVVYYSVLPRGVYAAMRKPANDASVLCVF